MKLQRRQRTHMVLEHGPMQHCGHQQVIHQPLLYVGASNMQYIMQRWSSADKTQMFIYTLDVRAGESYIFYIHKNISLYYIV